MADFAPYQDTSPDTTRALSPPPNRRSTSFSPPSKSPIITSDPWNNHHSNTPSPCLSQQYNRPQQPGHARQESSSSVFGNNIFGGDGPSGGDVELGGSRGGREALNDFETSLPLRLDYEACLAYLLLPPVGGVVLLIFEWKSDYVRFHAWQSALLFTFMFFFHLIFSWSSFMSWIIFLGDLGLIGYLTMRAYQDADTLDRYEVPFFGPLASRWVDYE